MDVQEFLRRRMQGSTEDLQRDVERLHELTGGLLDEVMRGSNITGDALRLYQHLGDIVRRSAEIYATVDTARLFETEETS